jgi:hypothetical protein
VPMWWTSLSRRLMARLCVAARPADCEPDQESAMAGVAGCWICAAPHIPAGARLRT